MTTIIYPPEMLPRCAEGESGIVIVDDTIILKVDALGEMIADAFIAGADSLNCVVIERTIRTPEQYAARIIAQLKVVDDGRFELVQRP